MNKLQNVMQLDFASVEKTEEKRQEWFQKFYEQLVDLNFIPAGRVLYGAGAGTDVTYFNCYVMPFVARFS